MLSGRKDILWKAVIEDLFPDFLGFFYPDEVGQFELSRGVDFMDKELGEMHTGMDMRHPRFVDKLVKVYRKDGKEELLLIHIEVQDSRDKDFARRMFRYFYRILDRFNLEVASIAIFTDNDPRYCPDRYGYRSLGTSNEFRYKTYKVKGQDKAMLEKSRNPFAMVILTVLLALEKGKLAKEELVRLSLLLVRKMMEKGFEQEKMTRLMEFLNYSLYFGDKETFEKFETAVQPIIKKTKSMGLRELMKVLLLDEAMEKGEVEGRSKGMAEGEVKAKVSIIKSLLTKTGFSLKKIADIVGEDFDFVLRVKNEMDAVENNLIR